MNTYGRQVLEDVSEKYFSKPIQVIDSDLKTMTQGYTESQKSGFKVDECIKRLFNQFIISPSPRLAPYDIELEDLFIEIKSTNKSSSVNPRMNVYVSESEYLHAKKQLAKGKDTIYLYFCSSKITSIKFIGCAKYSEICDCVMISPYPRQNMFTQNLLVDSIKGLFDV